jgi:hypothetical protein
MSAELEFIQFRLQIIEEQLNNENVELEPLMRMRIEREQRLLRRVANELPEGQVLETVVNWRFYLGGLLQDHKLETRAQQRKYDRWLRLSRSQREVTPQPPQPSIGTTSTDANGDTWVIDDRFLAMMDDLIARLRKWLESAP